jgi:hypothetical protein
LPGRSPRRRTRVVYWNFIAPWGGCPEVLFQARASPRAPASNNARHWTARVIKERNGMTDPRIPKSLDCLKRMIEVLLAKKDGLYPKDMADARVRQIEKEAFNIAKEKPNG